ncbi:multidrug effflux MFS transporter [Sphingosinicella sp. CPCC 101087]|uniref:multidrug effflux MFS transporter n=1 Tax=Sphingosinicella sp. CPCC 101087 TaxID=2497754 RepID=UPI00101CF433|nr:multidrug effflux MFS transporter [Sphingosinicella sp. CPCC 101087]
MAQTDGMKEAADAISAAASRRVLGRQVLVLGLVSLSSPLALNMYVPAFPEMAADLGTDPAAIQLSLTSLLAALAVGQNIYGPLSDRYGRKPPLYFGLGLFVLSSIAVAFAPTLEALVAWRFVQGLGACAAMAIPRAIVRDLHTGPEAARIMALMLLVTSIAPLLAPLAGSALTAAFSWRYIFWFMATTGALGILMLATLLPETRPPHRRGQGGARGILLGYGLLLGDRHFLGLVLMLALSQAAFFAYLGGSPFVFMSLYGLEGWQYGLLFGASAAFWAGAAQFAPMAMNRFGARRLLIWGAAANAAALLALLTATTAGQGGPVPLLAAVILMFVGTGIMMPAATVTALHRHGSLAGTASALMGTAAYAAGGLASAAVSALADGSDRPLIAVMTFCLLLAFAAVRMAYAGRPVDDDHLGLTGSG